MDLKKIESWCMEQIDLLNRLGEIEETEGIELICNPYQTRVHVYAGIENIAAALKATLKIELKEEFYEKSVLYRGITFFQIESYPKAGAEK